MAALEDGLADLAQAGLWLALPLPAISVLQSWFQGAILYGRETQGISESVVLYFTITAITLGAGIVWGNPTGLYVGMVSLVLSNLAQAVWLWVRGREVMASVCARDQMPLSELPIG